MATIPCDYAGLREGAGEFIKLSRTANEEALDAGLKCVNLMYIGCEFKADHERAGAEALLRIISRVYFDRLFELVRSA